MVFLFKIILFFLLFFSGVRAEKSSLANKVSMSINVGFGGRYDLNYERRFAKHFGLETGWEIGEDFLGVGQNYSKVRHTGLFASANLYVFGWQQNHQLYISPRISLGFGDFNFSQSDTKNNGINRQGMTSLRAAAFMMYRYVLPFNMLLEAGLGVDAISLIVPFDKAHISAWRSLPIPKIHLGIGYTF